MVFAISFNSFTNTFEVHVLGIGAGPVWCLFGLRSGEPVVNRMYTCCFRRSSSLVGFQTFVGR